MLHSGRGSVIPGPAGQSSSTQYGGVPVVSSSSSRWKLYETAVCQITYVQLYTLPSFMHIITGYCQSCLFNLLFSLIMLLCHPVSHTDSELLCHPVSPGCVSAGSVPQCFCNVGYRGVHCGKCDFGFHRAANNHCVPCNCSGNENKRVEDFCDGHTGL